MRNSRLISVVLLMSLLFPMFIAPVIYIPTSTPAEASSEPAIGPNFFTEPLAVTLPPDAIRVAIYNEPNTASPSSEGGLGSINTNSSSQIASILQAAGYQTTMLSTNDIYNHQLLTAHYDVFVIPDTLPREHIINQIYEYWLGGGALLGFDSFAVYSCYMGIMTPATAGTNGHPGYWTYSGDGANVTTRHPVSKAYAVGDTYNLPPYGYAEWDWTALVASVYGSDFTRVAHDGLNEDEVTVLAYDPSVEGGRVVHFWWDGSTEPLPGIHQMICDAVEWLCPRPKGRIVYDLSHLPRRSIDPWDSPYSMYPGSYTEMRNEWVSHGFLVDKLYPAASGDNFTLARLNPYDMLVVNVPDYNYTAGDRTAFQSWANNGGSVLAFGDYPDPIWFTPQNHQTSMLLSPFGLTINDTFMGATTLTTSTFTMHPITEGCSSFYLDYYGAVNVSGSATGVWYDGPNIVVAASTYGSGRAVLVSDMNWIQDGVPFSSANNRQSILNMANWLSSSLARVLIYTDEAFSINYYRTPVARALNDLGIKFYLTGPYDSPRFEYFNHSLNLYSWDFVIVDNADYGGLDAYYDDLVNYLDAGGSLIFSTWTAGADPAHRLWDRLGVAFQGYVSSDPQVFVWDPAHDIFTMPHLFTISNFNTTFGYSTDGAKFTVYSNATALAGNQTTTIADGAFLIERNDHKTLLNGYIIDNFGLDEDDSTYEDRFELWINEIAYMMAPRCVLIPNVPVTATTGFAINFECLIENVGLTGAVEGEITATVPPGLGTLSTPATVPFFVAPGGSQNIVWSILVGGAGNFTLLFDADYYGLAGTTYSAAQVSADIQAIPLPFTPPPIPGLPWWWWIVALVIVIIIIVVIVIYLLMRRRSSSK